MLCDGRAYFPNVAAPIAAGGEANGAGACGACTPMPSLRRELFERFQGVDGDLVFEEQTGLKTNLHTLKICSGRIF